MSLLRIALSGLGALSASVGTAHAADTVKPGLWETRIITMTVDGKDMLAQMSAAQEQMRQAIAKLPPEQRKKMEAMGAMGSSSGGAGLAQKICITPEMAARDDSIMHHPPRAQCEPAKMSRSGNRSIFELSCRQGQGTMTVKGETLFSGDAATTKVESVSMEPKGIKRVTVTESRMAYLGQDCGSVTPMDGRSREAGAAARR